MLNERGVLPEQLPAAEDVKKVQRKLATEEKKIPKQTRTLKKGKKH
jgi:DNA-damage-inducible protein D